MTRSSILFFLLAVGLLWAAAVSWIFIALGGAAELTFVYLIKSFLLYSWMFIGPLLLIAGAILALRTRHRTGSTLSLIGCTILTITVGYILIEVLEDLRDPLIAKPSWGLYSFAIILTILADVGSVQLHPMIFMTNRRNGPPQRPNRDMRNS